jgi:hypothetical protein
MRLRASAPSLVVKHDGRVEVSRWRTFRDADILSVRLVFVLVLGAIWQHAHA